MLCNVMVTWNLTNDDDRVNVEKIIIILLLLRVLSLMARDCGGAWRDSPILLEGRKSAPTVTVCVRLQRNFLFLEAQPSLEHMKRFLPFWVKELEERLRSFFHCGRNKEKERCRIFRFFLVVSLLSLLFMLIIKRMLIFYTTLLMFVCHAWLFHYFLNVNQVFFIENNSIQIG